MRRIGLVLASAIVVVGFPALADEIVYFTNGTSMPVESHEIDGERIKVVLSSTAEMAFPLEQVDRVEDAQGKVVSSRSSGYNRAVPGMSDPSDGRQTASAPARFKRGQWDGNEVPEAETTPRETDSNGMAVARPFGTSEHPGKRKVMTTGTRSIFNQEPITNRKDGVIGTTRMGNKSVIPRGQMAKRPAPVAVTQRPAGEQD